MEKCAKSEHVVSEIWYGSRHADMMIAILSMYPGVKVAIVGILRSTYCD